mmetsp:Transcript_182472/g.578260  ORF Transcript_182472/g.578260 Transcript_182472/m.578260 type:complete len:878 (+) Transcript_182472:75-2708(+)
MVSKDVFGLPLPPSAAGLRLPPKVAERGCAGAGHAAGEEGLRRFGGGGAASNASSSSPPTCHGSSNSLGSCQSSPSSPSTPPRGGDGVVDTLPGRLALPAMNDRGVDILNTFIATTYTGFMSTVMRHFRARFADPSAPVRRLIGQAVSDITLSPEQQEVVWRVLECNSNWWEISVAGRTADVGALPWTRPVGLNMALLHYYHNQLMTERCFDAISTLGLRPPPLARGEAEEALRFCRWAVAAYCSRGEIVPPNLGEQALVDMAAEIAGVDVRLIEESELCDASQNRDPLCPRYLIAVDKERNEVILAVRGTSSSSDMMADLIGDPVPFAGGLAHGGIADSAQRLLQRTADLLQTHLGALDASRPRSLVLTGHSLGAGCVGLLGILLMGGKASAIVDGSGMKPTPTLGAKAGSAQGARRRTKAVYSETIGGGGWCLRDDENFKDVQLRTFLYAPPPVYTMGPECDRFEELRATHEGVARSREAAMRAMECAVGFAINYDIIPRTSLHNGYNLLQQARAVDLYVPWRKRDILRSLNKARPTARRPAKSRAKMAAAVSAAIAKAAEGPPAPPNPFARQHPVAASMYHIWGASGGTSAGLPQPATLENLDSFRTEVLEDGAQGPIDAFVGSLVALTSADSRSLHRGLRPEEEDEEEDPTASISSASRRNRLKTLAVLAVKMPSAISGPSAHSSRRFAKSPCLYKKSQHFSEWRSRYAFVSAGHLYLSRSPDPKKASTEVPLTAVGTQIVLHGGASAETFPPTIVRVHSADVEAAGSTPTGRKRLPPNRWQFTIRNEANELLCPNEAQVLELCAYSSEARDAWVRLLVGAIQEARVASFAMAPAAKPEEWGREALISQGFVGDHSAVRYEAALESFVARFDG